MKRSSFSAVSIALVAYVGSAAAEPMELNGHELDAVTAGSASETDSSHVSGGMVVANNSEATVENTSSIDLSASSQMDVQALNLVTAADSLVGQGFNVWDGNFVGMDTNLESQVEQSNRVTQTASTRSATIGNYEREPSKLVTSKIDQMDQSLDTMNLDSEVSVDTSHSVLGQEVNVGLGLGISGRVQIDVDPADISFLLEADSKITTIVDVDGEINLPKPFGSMQAKGKLDNTIEMGGKMTLDVSTPGISIEAIGSVCYTKLGVCSAKTLDNSIYDTTSTYSEEHLRHTRGALSVSPVEAEYVVIDDSSLTSTQAYSIVLADNAQAGAQAVNVINAAGGSVANGINIARTGFSAEATQMPLNLQQINVVTQRY